MKQQLTFLCLFAFGFFATAQQTTVNLSLQPDYTDQVYYQFSTNTSQTFSAASWDIAFLRTNAMSTGIRVNDGAGIKVYEASNNVADWGTIDPANSGNWTELFNSDTTWTIGAFDQGSATYGWGDYNSANHHVEGSVIFVLEYADGSFKKFMAEDYFGGYTFKYADWNATNSIWEADETYVFSNATNPNSQFNYFSLTTDSEVLAAPEMGNWDLVFKKFTTDVGGGMMYPVTGALHNSNVTVAENSEPNGTPDTSNLQFSEEINTIGYDWKNFDGSSYILDADNYFYLKYADGTVYRFHFLTFEGGSTGNLSFEYEDVTNLMSTTVFDAENSFRIFPNPSTDGRVQVLYENNQANGNGSVAVFSLTGKKVFETQLKNNGFYNQTIDLSMLSSGVYLMKFQVGDYSDTKKIILK